MALCVSPPPQGFSHARCSSKILTSCPASANCSPHIAPEGPPPMIAISDTLIARREGQAFLGDGEDHQAKSSQKYSTEDRCRQRRTGFPPHQVHPHPLEHKEQRQEHREQEQQDRAAVQHKDSKEKHEKRHKTQGQCDYQPYPSFVRAARSEEKLLREQVRKRCDEQNRKPRPAPRGNPGFHER